MNKITQLVALLHGKNIRSANSEYHCAYADQTVIVFSATRDTRKIMVPTDLALEWVQAYDFGLIDMNMNAREMRDIVKEHSAWAAYQHGFETQMYAIVKTWVESHPHN